MVFYWNKIRKSYEDIVQQLPQRRGCKLPYGEGEKGELRTEQVENAT